MEDFKSAYSQFECCGNSHISLTWPVAKSIQYGLQRALKAYFNDVSDQLQTNTTSFVIRILMLLSNITGRSHEYLAYII